MINQLMVGRTHAVLAEAAVLAESAGIDAARIPECLTGEYADSSVLQKLCPSIIERNFSPQGHSELGTAAIFKLYEARLNTKN